MLEIRFSENYDADLSLFNRKIGRSREEARREREAEEQENGLGSSAYPDEDDDDMQL
jgi:hypothetical protein